MSELGPTGVRSPGIVSQSENCKLIDDVLIAWRALDLAGKQPTLDQSSVEMTERHEASLNARKDLTAATKEFRKLSDEEKVGHLSGLLKKYQDEVDVQTRRARAAEKAFVSLYRELYVAPDPVPALAAALSEVEKVEGLESRIVELEGEVGGLEEELGKLNNQDITIREMETRLLTMEKDIDEQVAQRVKGRELELRNQLEVELSVLKDKESAGELRIQQADDAVIAAQKMTDEAQNELMELRNRFDEMNTAHRCELEMLSEEVERLQVALNEARKQPVVATTSTLASRKEAEDAARQLSVVEARAAEAESEVIRQQATISALTNDVKAWEESSTKLASLHKDALQKLQAEVDSKSAEVSHLRRDLASRPSVEDVNNWRQQLSAYEALYFNVEDSGATTVNTTEHGDDGGIHSTVHAIVLKRVRQLESQLTKQSREHQKLVADWEVTRKELVEATDRIADQKMLIEKLENALENQTSTPKQREQSSTSVKTPVTSSFSHDSQLRALLGDHSSSMVEASIVNEPEDATSLVGILKAQRDRFRSQMLDLEAQRDQLTKELEDTKTKCDRLLGDNVMLIEKIKYLESYARVPSSALASNQNPDVAVAVEGSLSGAHIPGLPDPRGGGVRVRSSEDVERPYRDMYEERVNPFTDFNRREKMKRYGNLSAAEKITLNSTRLFMASKFARTFVFFYAVGLHCLVFATLYHFTHVAHH